MRSAFNKVTDMSSTSTIYAATQSSQGVTEKPILRLAMPDIIRVCHVSMSLETGGLERLLVDFSRFHDRSRFAMQFVGLSGDGQPAADIRSAECPARVLNTSVNIRKLRTVFELANVLRSERIQAVHTHNTYAHFYGALAAKLAGEEGLTSAPSFRKNSLSPGAEMALLTSALRRATISCGVPAGASSPHHSSNS